MVSVGREWDMPRPPEHLHHLLLQDREGSVQGIWGLGVHTLEFKDLA